MGYTAEARTGDTPANRRARQRERPPHILMTTPESLALLLSYEDSDTFFGICAASSLTNCTRWRPTSAGTCSVWGWRDCRASRRSTAGGAAGDGCRPAVPA